MKKYLLPLLLVSTPAFADTPREAFEGLHSCLTREASSCSNYFTSGSQELYGKVVTYDLGRCVPQEVSYVSETGVGSSRMVRAKIVDGESTHMARFNFTQENGQWKLNLPETLKRGLGEKWQSYVMATEQAYVFLQAQLKVKPGCEMVSALAKQPKEN